MGILETLTVCACYPLVEKSATADNELINELKTKNEELNQGINDLLLEKEKNENYTLDLSKRSPNSTLFWKALCVLFFVSTIIVGSFFFNALNNNKTSFKTEGDSLQRIISEQYYDEPTSLVSNSQQPSSKTLQGVKLLYIKGGTFTMGSPESEPERESNETQHRVTLSDFYLSEKAITNEQYCGFLNAKGVGNNGQLYVSGFGAQTLVYPYELGVQYSNGTWRPALGKANYPVVRVTWYGAKAWCDWAGGRLPTEAEWEYACRAGTTTPFNTGNNLTTSQANYDGNLPYNGNPKETYLVRTQPTGSYSPNAWGLYDMHGNVWEWCKDWDGDYETGSVTNPQGPSSGSRRILRGGSWNDDASGCRSARRASGGPDFYSDGLGFRLAASL